MKKCNFHPLYDICFVQRYCNSKNKTCNNKLNVFNGNYFEIGRNIQMIAMNFLQVIIYSFIYIIFQFFIDSLMKLCSLSSVIWSSLQILYFSPQTAPTVCGEKVSFPSFVVNLFMCSVSVFFFFFFDDNYDKDYALHVVLNDRFL